MIASGMLAILLAALLTTSACEAHCARIAEHACCPAAAASQAPHTGVCHHPARMQPQALTASVTAAPYAATLIALESPSTSCAASYLRSLSSPESPPGFNLRI